MAIEQNDRGVLRDLAAQVAEIARTPEMAERRRRWVQHNSLRSTYPMILLFPEGSWSELLPETALRCVDRQARGIERQLRVRLYTSRHFVDDTVLTDEWCVRKHVRSTGWGLERHKVPSTEARGAWKFDPVIKNAADLGRLHHPEIKYDETTSLRALAEMEDLFGDILTVKLCGVQHVSFHLMNLYTGWRGLEEVMVDMYSEPGMLHDAMAFLTEGHRRLVAQYVDQNLLSFNNDNTYHNSGGNGFTDELPPPGADPLHVRPGDMWASAEAQEMAQVGPEQHAEFVLKYEKKLLAPFGLTGYGCCEDLTRKLDLVAEIPQIRRISIAPSADTEMCAPALGGRYIFSWKPQPSHLVGQFDVDFIRAYIRRTVRAAKDAGCVLEMILKDTHTCEFRPERFDEWTRAARQVVAEEWGEPENAEKES